MRKTVSTAYLAPPPGLAREPIQSRWYDPSVALRRFQATRKQAGALVPTRPRQRIPEQNPPFVPNEQTLMDAGTAQLDYSTEVRKRFPGAAPPPWRQFG